MTGGIYYGIISSIYDDKAEVSCPGIDGEVTVPLPFLGKNRSCYVVDSEGVKHPVQEEYHPGQWIVIAVEGEDINGGVILT